MADFNVTSFFIDHRNNKVTMQGDINSIGSTFTFREYVSKSYRPELHMIINTYTSKLENAFSEQSYKHGTPLTTKINEVHLLAAEPREHELQNIIISGTATAGTFSTGFEWNARNSPPILQSTVVNYTTEFTNQLLQYIQDRVGETNASK